MHALPLAVLQAYLALFAFFAPHREHARREHALIAGGLYEAYLEYRAGGLRSTPAAFAALWDHLAELWPHVLVAKTCADARFGPSADQRYALRLAGGGVALVAGSVLAVMLLLPAEGAPPDVPGRSTRR